jgi:uncharacterized protein YjdB
MIPNIHPEHHRHCRFLTAKVISGMEEKKGQYDQAELSLTYITFRKESEIGKKAALQAAVVEDTEWSETELSWNNRPTFTVEENAVRKSQEYELGEEWAKDKNDKPKKDFPINGSPINIDITDFINAALEKNTKTLTLAVNDSAGLEHYFVSREGALGTDGKGTGKYEKATSDMAPAILLNVPQQPEVKGPATMRLQEGYASAETDSFAVLGFENPIVELSGNTGGGKITWDHTTHQLKIAEGIAKGEYTVTITASESEGKKTGNCNFTLIVTEDVKAELRELYLAKKELLPVTYTSASWLGFQSALTVAENVLKKENVSAEQAKEAFDRLVAAEKGLVTLDSVRQGALDTYKIEESNKDFYTEGSWNAYWTAYQAVQNLGSGYTEEQLNTAIEALQDAHQKLEEKENPVPSPEPNPGPNPEELKAAIDQAAKDYTVADSEKEKYTKESWDAYQKACQALLDLQKKGSYSETEVNQAIEALKKAYQELKKVNTQVSNQIKVNGITLDGSIKQLAKGKTVQLKAVVAPANASDKSLEWTSSKEAVASVDDKGLVTARGKGTAVIRASAKDGSGISGTYQIIVVNHAIKKIVIKSDSKKIAAGKKIALKTSVSVTGKDVNKTLVWTTSNKKYAAVSTKGVVTAKKAGKGKTVTIKAMSIDGTNKKASIKLRIK